MEVKKAYVREPFKVSLVSSLIFFCIVLTFCHHIFAQEEFVFTHVFYLPIVLAGIWWGFKALGVPIILALSLWSSHILSGLPYPLMDDMIQGLMFIVIGVLVGLIANENNRAHQEALEEKKKRIENMEAHFEYVQKVAHELRNPLQATLSVVDSLERDSITSDQHELLKVLERSTERMCSKIKELTNDR